MLTTNTSHRGDRTSIRTSRDEKGSPVVMLGVFLFVVFLRLGGEGKGIIFQWQVLVCNDEELGIGR